ncbi:MAG: hypothetical protein FHK80_06995 [Azoarcus sp. PHD]|nr:MAG: hypothetical protein FHK80_06995 [Azoarcus sp. PHD]
MQMSQPPAQNCASDEISLLDMLQILVKRKALIVTCVMICVVVAAAFAFLSSPVFEAAATLRIGQVNSGSDKEPSVLLEDASELVARVLAHGEIDRAAVQKGSTTIVQLTTSGQTPDEAARKLENEIREILEVHRATLAESSRPIVERIEVLDQQRQTLIKQSADIDALVEELKRREPVQAAFLVLERGTISSVINQHEAERLRLARLLTPPHVQATELLGGIGVPAAPVKPKKVLVLALAVVLGLMGGVMLAFLAELIAKAKAQSRCVASSNTAKD